MRKNNKHYEDVLEQGKALIDFYNHNPCIAAYDLLGVDLAPIQRLVFQDMWFKDYNIVVAARGFGKTFILGLLSALSCMLRPGYRVGLIAPVFRQCFPIITDTYNTLWTSSGLYSTINDFYDSISIGDTCVQSLNSHNVILNKWQNPKRECISIETEKGLEVSGTVDHRVLVLDDDMSFTYKELKNIVVDDYMVIRKGFNYFGNNNSMPQFDEFDMDWRTKDCEIPEILTKDLAYWMGLLVGDGCVSISKDERKQRVDFVSEDLELLDYFEDYLREYFLVDKSEKISRNNRKNNTWEIEYYCKKLIQYLLKCGFTKTTALDKKIPDIIKKACREIFIAFIQGLFDTNGAIYVQNHKNGHTHCEVTFNTSSIQLAKEVQSLLLNLGIVSNLTVGSKECIKKLKCGNNPSKCSEGYKIRITGYEDLYKFSNLVNFRLSRKKITLLNCINKMRLKRSNTLIPNINNVLLSTLLKLKVHCHRGSEDNKFIGKIINRLKSGTKKINIDTIKVIIDIYNKLDFNDVIIDNLSKLINTDIILVRPKKFSSFEAETIDIEVENESCYWANGFINHNSKMIFAEVEKLYLQSPLLREACEKKPTNASDRSFLKFKSVAGMTPSYIEALPLGDGNKIRGSRFYLIVVDELAQVPDQTLDMVVRPMAATSLAPMERVRRLERQKKLIELGLATEDDFEQETVNKMVMASSGYYKFNHMWRRMKDHWRMMDEAEAAGEISPYSVWQVPYQDLPPGFSDENNIAEAKRIMSDSEFRMEYEAAMVSDSEGFFKASLLEECTLGSGHTIEFNGEKDAQYLLGVDPNQGGKASTGVVIVKIGKNVNRIVNVLELKGKNLPELTIAIQELCRKFNIIRIFMDKGGGGKAISDLLEEGYSGEEPIIDLTNKDHIHLSGRHILEPVNFNPSWISDANFTAKSMIEDKKLLFPEAPIKQTSDLAGKSYNNVNTLKSQMLSIIVTQTATGLLHFDTPTKGQNKDLYSALILAAHGARIVERELEDDHEPILYNASGMVRPHKSQTDFRILGVDGAPISTNPVASAVLKKKIK